MSHELSFSAAIFALAMATPALAQDTEEKERIVIGFLDLDDDPRYRGETVYARIRLRAEGDPFPAAEVAVEESATVANFLKIEFVLERFTAEGVDDLVATIEGAEIEAFRQPNKGRRGPAGPPQRLGHRRFNHAAQIHNDDTVGNMFHHAQIMADEKIRKSKVFL